LYIIAGGSGGQRTYLPPRDKVYALIDHMVEGTKTEEEVLVAVKRWWGTIPASERKIVHRELLNVLAKSEVTIEAISRALIDLGN
jgi:hypothetical protein